MVYDRIPSVYYYHGRLYTSAKYTREQKRILSEGQQWSMFGLQPVKYYCNLVGNRNEEYLGSSLQVWKLNMKTCSSSVSLLRPPFIIPITIFLYVNNLHIWHFELKKEHVVNIFIAQINRNWFYKLNKGTNQKARNFVISSLLLQFIPRKMDHHAAASFFDEEGSPSASFSTDFWWSNKTITNVLLREYYNSLNLFLFLSGLCLPIPEIKLNSPVPD